MFLNDNDRTHTAGDTHVIWQFGWEQFNHPPVQSHLSTTYFCTRNMSWVVNAFKVCFEVWVTTKWNTSCSNGCDWCQCRSVRKVLINWLTSMTSVLINVKSMCEKNFRVSYFPSCENKMFDYFFFKTVLNFWTHLVSQYKVIKTDCSILTTLDIDLIGINDFCNRSDFLF